MTVLATPDELADAICALESGVGEYQFRKAQMLDARSKLEVARRHWMDAWCSYAQVRDQLVDHYRDALIHSRRRDPQFHAQAWYPRQAFVRATVTGSSKGHQPDPRPEDQGGGEDNANEPGVR